MRVFDGQHDLEAIAQQVTNQVNESLRRSFCQTGSMKNITLMDWPSDFKEFTYMSDTIEVTTEDLEKRVMKKKSKKGDEMIFMRRPVIVELLDLRWFFN